MTRYLIDFDSTLVAAETLDVLGEIALADATDREARLAEVRAITEAAMDGRARFAEALLRRLGLLQVRREHLAPLIVRMAEALTPSARRNAAFLSGPNVTVVSGGFMEVIAPVLAPLGVAAEAIAANRLVFGADGRLEVIDASLPLARDGGKVEVARALARDGAAGEAIVMVGDGWTDYEVFAVGAATRFYAFTEAAARPRVLAHADRRAVDLDDLLAQESRIAG